MLVKCLNTENPCEVLYKGMW